MLQGKRLKYVEHRLAGYNKRQSAIKSGHSVKTACQAATRLEKDPEIIEALNTVEGERLISESKSNEQPPSDADNFSFSDPKDFLLHEMNDPEASKALRHDAAKTLMPYIHGKKGEIGKKEAASEKAKGAGGGKFAPTQAPKLVISNA